MTYGSETLLVRVGGLLGGYAPSSTFGSSSGPGQTEADASASQEVQAATRLRAAYALSGTDLAHATASRTSPSRRSTSGFPRRWAHLPCMMSVVGRRGHVASLSSSSSSSFFVVVCVCRAKGCGADGARRVLAAGSEEWWRVWPLYANSEVLPHTLQ
eukprot:1968860-Rhodomonas_salina.2